MVSGCLLSVVITHSPLDAAARRAPALKGQDYRQPLGHVDEVAALIGVVLIHPNRAIQVESSRNIPMEPHPRMSPVGFPLAGGDAMEPHPQKGRGSGASDRFLAIDG